MPLSDRQREIIDAALILINNRGIQELTMKRIAAAIGVSEPALYRHFASKSEILSAVVGEMESFRAQALAEARSSGHEAAATLSAFFEAHAMRFVDRPELTIILFSEDVFRNDPSLLSRIDGIVSATQKTVRDEVERGKRSREFKKDLNAETAALMLTGGFRLLVSTWRLRNRSFDLPAKSTSLIDSAMRLFKA